MIRKKCLTHDHRWVGSIDGFFPSMQFCSRWFCAALRPDPTLSPEIQVELAKSAVRTGNGDNLVYLLPPEFGHFDEPE